MEHPARTSLLLKRMGIDTHEEPVVYMQADCDVCRSEGFSAHSRVTVATESSSIIATLNVVRDGFVLPTEAGLSDAAWRLLDAQPGQRATFSHPRPVESFGAVRAKIFGHAFTDAQLLAILEDMAAGRYTDIDLSAFLTACTAAGMSLDEVVWLTHGMVRVGERVRWDQAVVADKHGVGGLPGNRTTPIIVSIVAAAGVCIPKTSSRAITSPSGTADAMETLTTVDLDLPSMRRVVEREGGCMIWGGAIHLSPVDDLLISVERALDLDSDAQLVASVLSKKAAAGATHVVIDIPVGPTAKIRTLDAARAIALLLERVGNEVGLVVRPIVTDGSQPIGRGIGPALEARDVLAVVKGDRDAPSDLRDRAVFLAAEILELAGACAVGSGISQAHDILADGRAWRKLQAICEAQGGLRTPPVSSQRFDLTAPARGTITGIDSRRLARAAKLAGAPADPAAGIELHVRMGHMVDRGQPIFTLHAESAGELAYAREYLDAHPHIVVVGEAP